MRRGGRRPRVIGIEGCPGSRHSPERGSTGPARPRASKTGGALRHRRSPHCQPASAVRQPAVSRRQLRSSVAPERINSGQAACTRWARPACRLWSPSHATRFHGAHCATSPRSRPSSRSRGAVLSGRRGGDPWRSVTRISRPQWAPISTVIRTKSHCCRSRCACCLKGAISHRGGAFRCM